jgi:iron complex outermembrane receptor protein
MSATKTATRIEELPQSIQVLPRSLLDDQRPLTVTEAIQNVSSVQGVPPLGIGNTDLQPLRVRGFGAEQWLDGMTVPYVTGDRDAFANVERIEVLKGPSAILYGGGPGAPVGGAVNIVSKLPTSTAHGEFGAIFGSNAYVRPYFDVDQPLTANGTVLFRVTGEYMNSDSFVDVLQSERYSINPTLTFTDRTNTTLTIQGRVSRWEQQAYPGLPAVGTIAGNFRIDRKLYAGDPDIIPSYTKVHGITVTLDHRFDSVWSFNVKGRWSKSEFDQHSQGPSTAAPDLGPTTWSLINTEVLQRQEEFSINPNLQARFSVGPTRNTVLIGADYSRVTDQGFMNTDLLAGFVDLLNPVFPFPYRRPDPLTAGFFFPFFDFDSTYITKGVYGQAQTTIFDRIHLLGGLRLASIDIDYFERVPFSLGGLAPPELFQSSDTKLLPRVGIVVDLVKGFSLYGSYSEGMRATGFTQAHGVAPEFSKQREAGVKFNFGNQLTGTLAVFEIERSNIPVTLGVGVAALSEQTGKGFETDLLWQMNRSWSVLANYGYVDAVYADSLTGIPKGNHVTLVPEHSGRVWLNHAFEPAVLKGWSIGAGVYVSSGQYVDSLNIYKTEPFFTVDAKIGYENERFRAALHAKNLTGEHYFLPYSWFGGQVTPGDDRAFYGTFAVKY